MNPELEVRTAVDDENSTKQDRMKKQTKPSQAIRRVFREVSNETAHAVNGNSKALRSSENIARKIGKVSEKGTSTEDLPEKKFLCDRCQQNFSHDYDEDVEDLEKLLTSDEFSQEDSEKYWETVCDSTRECLKTALEEKEQIATELQKEINKIKSLEKKIIILEAKMDVLKKYLKSELGIDELEFSDSDDES